MRRKAWVWAFIAVTVAYVSAQSAAAQSYPSKPFEIICAYTPGSSQDIAARLIADVGGKYYGQPMVVVNKPGAAGSVAAADVISSKPEGYKAFQIAHVFFATTIRTQKLPFDPNDLVPLANLWEMRLGMLVKQDSPFKTLKDLIEHARKNPGQLKWSTVGRATTIHMSGLSIFRKAGVQTIEVPYKGTPEALSALLGGHVDAGSLVYGATSEQVRAGKARFLLFYTDKRYEDHPDVPTAEELGYPEAVLPTYVGLYVHKNTPPDVLKRLREVFKKIYDDPEFKKGIERMGEVPKWGGPEFIQAGIKHQEKVGIPILKELGLYVDK
jgi:tripartite-type tricarboxylate transporter receptor subunit TctC